MTKIFFMQFCMQYGHPMLQLETIKQINLKVLKIRNKLCLKLNWNTLKHVHIPLIHKDGHPRTKCRLQIDI